MGRLRFVGKASVNGVEWVFSVSDWWVKVIGVAALIGVSIGALRVDNFPSWIVALVGAALVVVALMEGAYREWAALDAAGRPSQSEQAAAVVAGTGGANFGGGGGGAASGPGAYAEGGQGGSGYSMYDALGRLSYETRVSVWDLAQHHGLDPETMKRPFGAGGRGGDSGDPSVPSG